MKKTLKNKILKSVTTFMAVLFLVATTALDSPIRLPLIVCAITEAYLILFMYVNRHTKIEVES